MSGNSGDAQYNFVLTVAPPRAPPPRPTKERAMRKSVLCPPKSLRWSPIGATERRSCAPPGLIQNKGKWKGRVHLRSTGSRTVARIQFGPPGLQRQRHGEYRTRNDEYPMMNANGTRWPVKKVSGTFSTRKGAWHLFLSALNVFRSTRPNADQTALAPTSLDARASRLACRRWSRALCINSCARFPTSVPV